MNESRCARTKWLRVTIQGDNLQILRASKRRVVKLLEGSPERVPEEFRAAIMRHRVASLLGGQQTALKRLFGKRAAERGCATAGDVERLCKRLERWTENLDAWRDHHAHRYGWRATTLRRLRVSDLGRKLKDCGRLMNDLRVLTDGSHFVMPSLRPSVNADSRDLVDLILMGSIHFAVEQWQPFASDSAPYLWQLLATARCLLRAHARTTARQPVRSIQ